MTIATAWVRTIAGGAEELLFCSDSRLTGGKNFDHCQKIFRFTRTDAAVCFAGRTDWAYPLVVAATKAADVHAPSHSRALGLAKFKNHFVNILNLMQSEVTNFADGEEVPSVSFIFGGYDWFQKKFRIWNFLFDTARRKFVAHEPNGNHKLGGLGKLSIAGDAHSTVEFHQKLKAILQKRFGMDMRTPPTSRFDLEPLEVVVAMLRGATRGSPIGGAPQLVKVYQFLNSVDVGVVWPNNVSGRLFISGRPLLSYEHATIYSVIDPDHLVSTWAKGTTSDALASVHRAIVASSN